ncbi:MAG: MFS transporter [Candidatus Methanomethylicia archaeon]
MRFSIYLNSATWRLNIATILFFTFIQMVIPLIPRYVLMIEASPSMIGIAVSSMSITAISLRPLFGVLSDKWIRSSLMLLGVILASVSYALLFFSTNIFTIIIARLIEGVAVASFIPSSIASAVDSAPNGKVGETLGWRSLMVGIGFTVGPGLGGVISQFFSYKVTFIIASLLLLLLIPLIQTSNPTRKQLPEEISIRGLSDKYFLTAFFSLIVYAVAWMGLLTFLSAYLKLLGYGDIEIGFFVSLQALSSLILRIIGGKLSDKYPERTTYLSLLIISLSFFMIYIFITPPHLYLASIVFGVGVGIFIPSAQTLALGRQRSSIGFLTSIYTMGMDLGNLTGPLLLGLLVEYSGNYMNAFLTPSILVFTASILVLLISEVSIKTKT